MRAAISAASKGSSTSSRVSVASESPTRSLAWPIRWYAESAFGLA